MTKYKINGKQVSKEEFEAREGVGLNLGAGEVPLGTVAYSESAPLISEGAGCLSSQVGELRQKIKKRNIQGVRVLDTGQLEITSRRGRKELLRMRGKIDNDGGYGD